METTLTSLKYVSTAAEINRFAEKMICEIREYEINPIEAYAQMKILESAFEQVKKQTAELIQDEVSKLNKNQNYFGFKWEVAESGIKYDFSGCGHSELNEINAEIERLNLRKKDIENALKSADKVTVIDEAMERYVCRR